MNTDEFVQVTSTLKRFPQECSQLSTYNIDKRPTRGPDLEEKRKSAYNRLHLLRPLFSSKLPLLIELLMHKSIIKPVCSRGIAIRGPVVPSTIRLIQAFQYL